MTKADVWFIVWRSVVHLIGVLCICKAVTMHWPPPNPLVILGLLGLGTTLIVIALGPSVLFFLKLTLRLLRAVIIPTTHPPG